MLRGCMRVRASCVFHAFHRTLHAAWVYASACILRFSCVSSHSPRGTGVCECVHLAFSVHIIALSNPQGFYNAMICWFLACYTHFSPSRLPTSPEPPADTPRAVSRQSTATPLRPRQSITTPTRPANPRQSTATPLCPGHPLLSHYHHLADRISLRRELLFILCHYISLIHRRFMMQIKGMSCKLPGFGSIHFIQ